MLRLFVEFVAPIWVLRSNTRYYVTLDPGDLIFTGTPPRVGFGMNPPQYLKPSDEIEVWVEKIGSLVNRVVDTN